MVTGYNILQHPANAPTSCNLATKSLISNRFFESLKESETVFNKCNKSSVWLQKVHNGQLWDRVIQIVKVETAFSEGAITFEQIRNRCPEVPLFDLLRTLDELTAARRLACRAEWIESEQGSVRMRLNYTFDK